MPLEGRPYGGWMLGYVTLLGEVLAGVVRGARAGDGARKEAPAFARVGITPVERVGGAKEVALLLFDTCSPPLNRLLSDDVDGDRLLSRISGTVKNPAASTETLR